MKLNRDGGTLDGIRKVSYNPNAIGMLVMHKPLDRSIEE